MIEQRGDFWQIVDALDKPVIICVTTNGVVKKSGDLVMGKGIALQFAKRFPGLPLLLGEKVALYGNIVHLIITPDYRHTIASFPTKHNWRDDSSLSLIEKSAMLLEQLVTEHNKNAYLTRPGCGNGNLSWEQQVKPILEKRWNDRFHIITN